MTIRYAIREDDMGYLFVAEAGKGLCAAGIADGVPAAERALGDLYPEQDLKRDDEGLGRRAEAILAYVDGLRPDAGLALDIQGTPFQRRVWEELGRIPRGETRTYAEIAQAIGRPDAVRAVGGACAANRLAIVIPCHRAVGKDGRLTGYRWGIERKKALLARETLHVIQGKEQPGRRPSSL